MRPPGIALLLSLAAAFPFWLAVPMGHGFLPGSSAGLLAGWGALWLAMSSGIYWGMAARGAPIWAWALVPLPVLHVFFFIQDNGFALPGQRVSHLILGLALTLVLDAAFQARGLAPRWWFGLRALSGATILAALWILRNV